MWKNKTVSLVIITLLILSTVSIITTNKVKGSKWICYPDLPSPVIVLAGTEEGENDGIKYTRYLLDVTNWYAYPDELFEPAPDLPPCGINTYASRTWVHIYDEDDKYIYGFCALSSAEWLNRIWFGVGRGEEPPEYVYITLVDRRCNLIYTSNLVAIASSTTADAGGPYSGLIGDPVQFTGSATGGIPPYIYTWDFDYNGYFTVDSTQQNPVHAYTTPGVYTVVLCVTDSTNATDMCTTTTIMHIDGNAPNPGFDDFANLGDLNDEGYHNLIGWGDAQIPPENPYVSPSGDWTKRYQLIRQDNSLDLYVQEVNIPYLLILEVEDGYCTDNFDIFVNGQGPLYHYTGINNGVEPLTIVAVRHQMTIPSNYITDNTVQITFKNTATDDCGLAAVYNVHLESFNQPPHEPSYLFQYIESGPEIPPGGTIDKDAVTFVGVGTDPDGDQVKLQIELRRLDEHSGNFLGVPTHESEFVDNDFGVLIDVHGLIVGYYHWQARTMDEHGLVSDWVNFGSFVHREGPADFKIRIHSMPYAQGNSYYNSDALGYEWATLHAAVAQINEVTGEGTIGLTAAAIGKYIGGGTAWGSAAFTLRDDWKSTITGQYGMVASFKISGSMSVVQIAIDGENEASGSLQAHLSVYDKTEGTMALQRGLVIFEENTEWWEQIPIIGSIGKWASGKFFTTEKFDNEEFVIEGPLELKENHEYEWTFRISMEGEAAAITTDAAWVQGLIDGVLMEIRLEDEGDPERWFPAIYLPFDHIATNENLKLIFHCPVAVMVIDPEGKRVGVDFDSMQMVNEIPGAWYSGLGTHAQFVIIPAPLAGNYNILVLGMDNGLYGSTVVYSRTHESIGEEAIGFRAIDIPISAEAIHQYTIDWDVLAQGEKGITIQVDNDGDGTFEQNIITDCTFQPPIANFTYSPENPIANQTIVFNASLSYDSDGQISGYNWSYTTVGIPHFPITMGAQEVISFAWTLSGIYNVTLRVTDDEGTTSALSKIIEVVTYQDWDVNRDNRTNILDLILIGQHWGETGPPCWISEDINCDGVINILDMILVGQHWTG